MGYYLYNLLIRKDFMHDTKGRIHKSKKSDYMKFKIYINKNYIKSYLKLFEEKKNYH